MVVDAVMHLDELLPLNMIGVKKVTGGALEVSLTHDCPMLAIVIFWGKECNRSTDKSTTRFVAYTCGVTSVENKELLPLVSVSGCFSQDRYVRGTAFFLESWSFAFLWIRP